MTEICIIMNLLMNSFACSYQPLTGAGIFTAYMSIWSNTQGSTQLDFLALESVAIVIEVNREGSGQHFLMLA